MFTRKRPLETLSPEYAADVSENESDYESDYESENESDYESPSKLLRYDSENFPNQFQHSTCYIHSTVKIVTNFLVKTTGLVDGLRTEGRIFQCDKLFNLDESPYLLKYISSGIRCDENTIVRALVYRILYKIVLLHDTNNGGHFLNSIDYIKLFCRTHCRLPQRSFVYNRFWQTMESMEEPFYSDEESNRLFHRFEKYLSRVYESLHKLNNYFLEEKIKIIEYNEDELHEPKSINFLKKFLDIGLYLYLGLAPIDITPVYSRDVVHDGTSPPNYLNEYLVSQSDDQDASPIWDGDMVPFSDEENNEHSDLLGGGCEGDEGEFHAVTIVKNIVDRRYPKKNGFMIKNSWGRENNHYGHLIVDGFLPLSIFKKNDPLNKYICGIYLMATIDQCIQVKLPPYFQPPRTKKRNFSLY